MGRSRGRSPARLSERLGEDAEGPSAVAERVLEETGLLPHLNPGNLTAEELVELKNEN